MIKNVLVQEKNTNSEILEYAERHGLTKKLSIIGKLPLKTMNACIHKNIKNENDYILEQISEKSALFQLKK